MLVASNAKSFEEGYMMKTVLEVLQIENWWIDAKEDQ